ncbi:hypothetical protein GCM10009839_66100 [Catenulispora yoronensis]|uniref:Sel1 repeat family protein n=1 Tax=Catenulispora yoronensis TaxID=450799 RepID=A0ABP5GPX7_9ACTN
MHKHAQVLYREARRRRALKYLRRAAAMGNLDAVNTLVGYLAFPREALERKSWMRRASQLAIEQKKPAIVIAGYLRAIEEFDHAGRVLLRAAKLGDIDAAFEVGLINEGPDGNATEAERRFRQAADAGHYKAQLKLGNLLMQSDRSAEGKYYYQKAIAQEPAQGRSATFELGQHLWKRGEIDKADQLLRSATTPADPHSNVYVYAEFLCEQGQTAKAIELLQARHGTSATTTQLREAAKVLRHGHRPDAATEFTDRADHIELQERQRDANRDYDDFD